MHFTKYLILLVTLYGMAEAQIIKSNVFVRTDLTNETDKATARALLGMFEWVTNSVPLTMSGANTVTLNATTYLDRLGVGPTKPIVNDNYALSAARKDHDGVSGMMVQNMTDAPFARAQYTMNGPTGLAYLGVAPSTASSAWANRAYIHTQDSKYGGLTLYWGNLTSDLKIYDSNVSERYRFASNGIAMKTVRAIPTAEVNVGWIYADDRTSAGGNAAPWVLTEDSRRGPVAFGDRSSVTTSLASFAGEMLTNVVSTCNEGWTLSDAGDFTLSGTSYSYTNVSPGALETVTMQTSLRSKLVANRVYDIAITLAGACVITNGSTIEVSLGGTVIGQLATTTSSFTATARCGSSTNLVLTFSTPAAGETRITFDTISVVPWATGDLMHSHTYTAASLAPSASAAPYFEFSASGRNAGNGNAKNKVVALAGSSATATPIVLFTATTSDNAGDWVLRGKVYATGASTAAAEFFYSDPAGVVQDSYPITTVTGWAWDSDGYLYIGANADTADSDVTVVTSSVEIKP